MGWTEIYRLKLRANMGSGSVVHHEVDAVLRSIAHSGESSILCSIGFIKVESAVKPKKQGGSRHHHSSVACATAERAMSDSSTCILGQVGLGSDSDSIDERVWSRSL